MSHFVEIEVDFDTANEQDLIKALEAQFGEGNVEVHEKGAALYGYGGDDRSKAAPGSQNYAPPCHLVVRRKNVGAASNDVGYRRNENGKYTAYISDYDQSSNFNKSKQGLVAQEYAANVAERTAQLKGWTTSRVKEGDKVRVVASRWR
jgi:hypothetical protein